MDNGRPKEEPADAHLERGDGRGNQARRRYSGISPAAGWASLDHSRKEPEAGRAKFQFMTGEQLINTSEEILRERDIVQSPIIWALKRTLKDVGQMLYDRVGSTDKLLEIAEQIANRDPENYGRRMAPIDSAWDGVGSGHDRWRG